MIYKPRPYQQAAIDAVIGHVKRKTGPCLIAAATGSGKSVIVSELARFFASVAPKKRVLCIQPSKELCDQNLEKYLSYGYPASLFCASAGSKCLRHQVIFASPLSAIKQIDKIARLGISAIILDEAHGISQTIKDIVSGIRDYSERGITPNKNVRVVGLTATPYRMGTGYIYAMDATGDEVIHHDEDKAINPYFERLVYNITASELLELGFLTRPEVGETSISYDTSHLEVDKFGNFSSKSVSAAFEGNTKTERIINKVLHTTAETNRKGVMIFAATISHAEEITKYLPDGQWALITGKTKKKEREQLIGDFKAKRVLFLVNVAVLCTGFDSSHVDYLAILRATESASLFQQIVGRSLRLDPNKEYALIHDFAENIERHGLQSDIFTPEIKTRKAAGEGEEIEVTCPSCNARMMKKRRNDPMYTGLEHDEFGNFLIAGTREVLTMRVLDPSVKDEFGVMGFKEIPVPAHYSRRCSNPEAYVIEGRSVPCGHRFSFKTCPHCFEDNDIAARHCTKCKERLVDPNQKLTETASTATVMAEGETRQLTCLGAEYSMHISANGNQTLKVIYKTEIGAVTGWHSQKQHWIFNRLARANGAEPALIRSINDCEGWDAIPAAVKVKKSIRDGFTRFEVKEVIF